MKTVQMVLEEELLAKVDAAAAKLRVNRSAFAREALRDMLRRLEIKELERQEREAYARYPDTEDPAWEAEEAWSDEDWSGWPAR